MMNQMLLSVAEISNTFSVLTVLLALFIMVILIFRLQGEEMLNPVAVTRPEVQASPMVRVFNPFLLKLQKIDSSLEGLASSQVSWYMQLFWGVNIKDLHQILYSDWSVFKELLLTDGLLLEGYLQKNELQHFTECNDKKVCLVPPSDLEEDLGPVPRTKYPLVIFMVNDGSESTASANTVDAMISIIHIKDLNCSMETCILMQYLKRSSGQVSCLKPLFVASDEEIMDLKDENAADVDASNEKPSPEVNLCVICQCEEITMALLPCRHACVCSDCFKQIDKCPMCRGFISTYFSIKDKANTEPHDETEEMNIKTKVEHYMRRLNSYLGFS